MITKALNISSGVIEGAKYAYMTQTATDHKTNMFLWPQTEGLGYTWTRLAHVQIEVILSKKVQLSGINKNIDYISEKLCPFFTLKLL